MLDGATPDGARSIARALAELAYQRGGVALAVEADALVVAFGLEVAGEDDVAIAMAWALDAATIASAGVGARDATAGTRLRIGARTGVAATTTAKAACGSRPTRSTRRVRSRATRRPIGRCSSAAQAG